VEDAGEDEGRVHSEVCAGLGQRKDRKEGERWMRGRMGLATLQHKVGSTTETFPPAHCTNAGISSIL
jgi:hypothetical protein